MPSFLSPLLDRPDARFVLRNGSALLASRVEPAFDSTTRRRGLLGRTTFAAGSALILAPCSGIHTFFMKMAIDVVFASRSGRVLKVVSAMPAWRLAFARGAFAAIELPAGTAGRVETKRGDLLTVSSE